MRGIKNQALLFSVLLLFGLVIGCAAPLVATLKSPEEHYELGRDYYRSEQYEEAIGEFKKAIEINPQYAIARRNLARAYTKTARYDEAIDELKKAIKVNPNYVLAYNSLGIAYRKKGMYDDALAAYKRALEINPTIGARTIILEMSIR